MTYLFPKSSLTSIFIPRFSNLFLGKIHKRIQLENSYHQQYSVFDYYCDTMKLNSYFTIIKYYEKNDENRMNPIDFVEANIYVENIDKKYNLCYHENIKLIDHCGKKENFIRNKYRDFFKKNIMEELMIKTWKPTRFMTWCLDNEEKKDFISDSE